MGVKIECTDVKGKCKTQLHGIGPLGGLPPPSIPETQFLKHFCGSDSKEIGRLRQLWSTNWLAGWGGWGYFLIWMFLDVGVLEYGCWRVGFLSPVIHPPTPPTLKCARFTLLQASQQAFPQPFYPPNTPERVLQVERSCGKICKQAWVHFASCNASFVYITTNFIS